MEPNKIFDLVNKFIEEDNSLDKMSSFGFTEDSNDLLLSLEKNDEDDIQSLDLSFGLSEQDSFELEDPFENDLEDLDSDFLVEDDLNTDNLQINKSNIQYKTIDDIFMYEKLTSFESEFLNYAVNSKFMIYISNNLDEVLIRTAESMYKKSFETKYDVISEYIHMKYYINISSNVIKEVLYEKSSDILDYINFPFRKITDSEINLIVNVYQEPWYIDYVLPLFSLEEQDSVLLVDIMRSERFNKEIFVKYVDNPIIFNGFLNLYKYNLYKKDYFDQIAKKDINIFNKYIDVLIENQNIDFDLINKIFIYDKSESINEFNTENIRVIKELLYCIEYPYFDYIYSLKLNGIYNENIIKNYLLKYPKYEWLAKIYSDGEDLFKLFDTFGDLFIAKILKDMYINSYYTKHFIEQLSTIYNNDNVYKVLQIILVKLLSNHYSNQMDLVNYKKWLILLSYDLEYCISKMAGKYKNLTSFNKYWYSYLLEDVGCIVDEMPDDIPDVCIIYMDNTPIFITLERILFAPNAIINTVKSFDSISISYGIDGSYIKGKGTFSVREPSMLIINKPNSVNTILFNMVYRYKSSLSIIANSNVKIDYSQDFCGIPKNELILKFNLYNLLNSVKNVNYSLINKYINMPLDSYSLVDRLYSYILESDYRNIFSINKIDLVIENMITLFIRSVRESDFFISLFRNIFQDKLKLYEISNIYKIDEAAILVKDCVGLKIITPEILINKFEGINYLIQNNPLKLYQKQNNIILELIN